jgi:4-hydroxy-tetrahydrodipicolinate reductase
VSRSDPASYSSVAEALDAVEADVLVDYTHATAVKQNVLAAIERVVNVVVGSSGLSAADFKEIDDAARERGVGVVAAGNFSLTAAMVFRAATDVARYLGAWEVIDFASAGKADAPSGTARELASGSARCSLRTSPCPSTRWSALSRRAAPAWRVRKCTRFASPASSSRRRWSSRRTVNAS